MLHPDESALQAAAGERTRNCGRHAAQHARGEARATRLAWRESAMSSAMSPYSALMLVSRTAAAPLTSLAAARRGFFEASPNDVLVNRV
jgi:hypothetical protein